LGGDCLHFVQVGAAIHILGGLVKRLSLIALFCVFAGFAVADDFNLTATEIGSFDIGIPSNDPGPKAPGDAYANVTNFSGFAFSNAGAANQSGNTITTLVADDITPTGIGAGFDVASFTFSVSNLNSVNVSARPRVRFYSDNAGLPGNALAGFSFNPITFTAGQVGLFTATLAPGSWVLPSGKFWAGITFDDNTGGTGITAAQLNNLGQGLFNPPTDGSSADLFFQTTAAGSFLSNNPPGGLFNFGGNPVANFGWRVVPTPEPASMAALGLGVVAVIRRRKKK
jgi:hypothetical protein